MATRVSDRAYSELYLNNAMNTLATMLDYAVNIINEDINSKIVVLDYGMSNHEKEDLLNICKECNDIYYVKNEFLKDYLDGRI